MELELGGKACIVTGASRGIGLATSVALCAEGARVLLVARDLGRLAEAAERCEAAGEPGSVEQMSADVAEVGRE